jgi:hypothetical protein
MKFLRKILFALALTVGLTMAVSAQKKDDKKPPKPPPPVIKPGEDKKPPKSDDKPKRPSMAIIAGKVGTYES